MGNRNPTIISHIVRVPLTAVVWLMLSGFQTGCLPQTCYDVHRVHVVPDFVAAEVQELRIWEMCGRPREADNYVVAVALEPPAPGASSGRVHLRAARPVIRDAVGEYSVLYPAAGTGVVIQAQETDAGRGQIIRCDTTTRRSNSIATFSTWPGDPDYTARALNRCGSELLIVTNKRATLWNTVSGRVVGDMPGPLPELEALIVARRGVPGDWWLTTNGRYVVVAPSSDVYRVGGSMKTPEPMPVSFRGMAININGDGVIYDRGTGALRTFPIQWVVGTRPLIDVETVGGAFRLLYQRHVPGGVRLELTDLDGTVLAAHTVAPSDGEAEFAGWDPEGGRFWYHVRHSRAGLRLPEVEPQADHALVSWDLKTGAERWYTLTIAQVRRAIRTAG